MFTGSQVLTTFDFSDKICVLLVEARGKAMPSLPRVRLHLEKTDVLTQSPKGESHVDQLRVPDHLPARPLRRRHRRPDQRRARRLPRGVRPARRPHRRRHHRRRQLPRQRRRQRLSRPRPAVRGVVQCHTRRLRHPSRPTSKST